MAAKLNRKWLFLPLAILAVPTVFGLLIRLSYFVASQHNQTPISYFSEWPWFALFGSCVIAGVSGIAQLPLTSRWARTISYMLYIPAIVGALLFVHLWVACISGDCI